MRHIPGGRGEPLGAAYLPIGGERHVDAHALQGERPARRGASSPMRTPWLFEDLARPSPPSVRARAGGMGARVSKGDAVTPVMREASHLRGRHRFLCGNMVPSQRGEGRPAPRRGRVPVDVADLHPPAFLMGEVLTRRAIELPIDPGMPAKACSPDTARYTGKAAVPPAHPDAIDVRWLRTEKETRVAPGLPRTTLCGAPGELSGPGRRRPRSWRTCCRQSRRTCGDRRRWRR